MPDLMDASVEVQEAFRTAAIEKVREKANKPRNEDPICFECGEIIEQGRLKANPSAYRCISCEAEKERMNSHGI